ncbi:hypothetical protein K470DRAFT_266360 [Piedraia hortae CBS 480.64]|uniref:Uncharacterized protein n=1 Tax=Piedraia hortae CBS 480.64 TaxID=1314780 RepID=A0A6A7BTK7_9PEZI|nr:hypothetical protein K470DRAFT_266360 [Piedraia hortae CBS 480.64]
MKQLCARHGKKRGLSPDFDFDNWDDFLEELRAWNVSAPSTPMDLERLFLLDELPVKFIGSLPADSTDRTPLNRAVRELVETIWQAGGFRFRHIKTRVNESKTMYFDYRCSQDEKFAACSRSRGSRNVRRMVRFPCQSKLNICPRLDHRQLRLSLHHCHHEPYSFSQFKLLKPRDSATTNAESEVLTSTREETTTTEQLGKNHVSYQDFLQDWTAMEAEMRMQLAAGNPDFVLACMKKFTAVSAVRADIDQLKNHGATSQTREAERPALAMKWKPLPASADDQQQK